MRRYKLSYFIGEGFKSLWRNGVMSLASITVLFSCLMVMGCFGALVVNIDHNMDKLGDLNRIAAFVDAEKKYAEGDTVTVADKLEAEDDRVTFLGWAINPLAEKPDIAAGGKYTMNGIDSISGHVTWYAVWDNMPDVSEYTIRYSYNGVNVEEEVEPVTDKYGVGYEVTIAAAPKARYSTAEFLGWSLSPYSEKAEYKAGDYYYVNADNAKNGAITFYAVWSKSSEITEYTVSYDSNGVDIKGELPTDEGTRLAHVRSEIDKLDNVKNVEFVSSEQALEEEKAKYADYPYLLEFISSGSNPYPNEFLITYEDGSTIDTLRFKLEQIEGIYKINSRTDFAQKIASFKNGVIIVLGWFMAILLVVSVFVIMNTIKLAVFARRQEISVMRYVGATKWFISLPFAAEGAIIGVFSSILSYLLMWYVYGYAEKTVVTDVKMIEVLPFASVGGYMLAAFLLVGILTGIIGSVISMRKYLKA